MSIIRADSLKNRAGVGAPNAPNGLTVTGVCTATTFSGAGASLTNLDASDLASGTIPDARFPATLPALNGSNLTNVSAGKVLQIVQEYNSSFPRLQTTSTTFTSSDFKVTITPTAANSKILVDFRFISNNNGLAHDCYMTIRRSIAGGSFTDDWIVNGSQSNTNDNRYLTRNYGSHSRNEISTTMQYLDSPSYTLGQAIEYKMYARSGNSSNAIEIPSSPSRTPVLCFATEIAA